MPKQPTTPPPFPTRQQLLAYIREAGGVVDKKDIAKAFHIRGDDRRQLNSLLKSLESDGTVEGNRGEKRLHGQLPPVSIIEIISISTEGDLIAKPAQWEDTRREPPYILVQRGTRGQAPAVGDRVLAKLKATTKNRYEATVIRVLPQKSAETVLGVYQRTGRNGGLLEPVNRKQKQGFFIPMGDEMKAENGELVLAKLQRGRNRQLGLAEARVIERLGDMNSPKSYSIIAIHHNDIPVDFSDEAIAEAESAGEPVADGRTDLRDIKLITIDGADARDFDDAVWAEPAKDGGWHLIVAIADVAHYVTVDSALDKDAVKRGNSTYFPDRVVPMLPEALSNGLCSLNPHVDRYCLAVHLWIDAEGNLTDYDFVRGIMRSHARTTYEQVQHAWDTKDAELLPVITPLYGAYASLTRHREGRGALELDLPEYQIKLGDDGHVQDVRKRQRLDSHKLIEEFMICANVAAANAIEKYGLAGIFRIHEPPSVDKVEELRELLRTLDYSLPSAPTGHHFNKLFKKAVDKPEAALISNSVLRSQMQAYYTPKNLGHFGLGLEQYCHFTSPIRRYADLVVHRALIAMLGLLQKPGSKPVQPDRDKLASIADHISTTERNSMLAEREANDRYITAFMADRQDAVFEGNITSVGSYGLFVTLLETGANGIVRMGDLGDDFFIYEEKIHSLIGRHSGQAYQLGQRVSVIVAEANIQLGSLRFRLVGVEPGLDFKKGKSTPYRRSSRNSSSQKPSRKAKNRSSVKKKRT